MQISLFYVFVFLNLPCLVRLFGTSIQRQSSVTVRGDNAIISMTCSWVLFLFPIALPYPQYALHTKQIGTVKSKVHCTCEDSVWWSGGIYHSIIFTTCNEIILPHEPIKIHIHFKRLKHDLSLLSVACL